MFCSRSPIMTVVVHVILYPSYRKEIKSIHWIFAFFNHIKLEAMTYSIKFSKYVPTSAWQEPHIVVTQNWPRWQTYLLNQEAGKIFGESWNLICTIGEQNISLGLIKGAFLVKKVLDFISFSTLTIGCITEDSNMKQDVTKTGWTFHDVEYIYCGIIMQQWWDI